MRDYLVTVCADCLTASCWHGEFMCERANHANVLVKLASELSAMNRENADNYSPEKLLDVCGHVSWVVEEASHG